MSVNFGVGPFDSALLCSGQALRLRSGCLGGGGLAHVGWPFDATQDRLTRVLRRGSGCSEGGAELAGVGLARSFDCAALRFAPFRFAQDERWGVASLRGSGALRRGSGCSEGALSLRGLAWPGPSTSLHSALLRSASLRTNGRGSLRSGPSTRLRMLGRADAGCVSLRLGPSTRLRMLGRADAGCVSLRLGPSTRLRTGWWAK